MNIQATENFGQRNLVSEFPCWPWVSENFNWTYAIFAPLKTKGIITTLLRNFEVIFHKRKRYFFVITKSENLS